MYVPLSAPSIFKRNDTLETGVRNDTEYMIFPHLFAIKSSFFEILIQHAGCLYHVKN